MWLCRGEVNDKPFSKSNLNTLMGIFLPMGRGFATRVLEFLLFDV